MFYTKKHMDFSRTLVGGKDTSTVLGITKGSIYEVIEYDEVLDFYFVKNDFSKELWLSKRWLLDIPVETFKLCQDCFYYKAKLFRSPCNSCHNKSSFEPRREIVTQMKNYSINKSPLGLIPKFVWESQRIQEIQEAIDRYTKAKINIPYEWVEEIKELQKNRTEKMQEIAIAEEDFLNREREISVEL